MQADLSRFCLHIPKIHFLTLFHSEWPKSPSSFGLSECNRVKRYQLTVSINHIFYLPGRDEVTKIASKHAVNGNPTVPPFPEHMRIALFGELYVVVLMLYVHGKQPQSA